MDLEAMITMTDRHEAIEGADYVLNMVHVSDVHPLQKRNRDPSRAWRRSG